MQKREFTLEESIVAMKGGESSAVAVSSTSAQSAAIGSKRVVLYATTDVFFRQGVNPTAVSNGTDQLLPANNMMRIVDLEYGNKLAFITTSATGTVYITPGA